MRHLLTRMAGRLLSKQKSKYSPVRHWEQWDKENIAQVIDGYWLASDMELAHREALARLVQQWILVGDRFLEIGCGTGLVYNRLVPDILPNDSYVGVDISKSMLSIANQRFSQGNFFENDLYALTFPDNSFDMVVAFEVFGHIPSIEKPIAEMFRVTTRLFIFTVWTGDNTITEEEVIRDAVFIHTTYSEQDVLKSIHCALKDMSYSVHTQSLVGGKLAYIIEKNKQDF